MDIIQPIHLTLNDTVYVGLSATQDGCLANNDNASVVGNVVNTLNECFQVP
ncbi:MAG: hypothetical protein IPN88_11020 [Bacteroidetes bacterium]|nr:hypothetical protein [Bacteroidota bacterium]